MPSLTKPLMETKVAQGSPDKGRETFTLSRRGGVLTLRFSGPRVGEREAGMISPQVRNAIEGLGHSMKGLVLDLSQVKVMSSYGLGLCIELRNVAMTHRAGTVLYGMCPDIRELFRVMKVDRLFTIALASRPAAKSSG